MGIRIPHGLSHISMPLPRPHKRGYVPRADSPISLCHCLPYSYAIGKILDFSILPYLYAVPPISLCCSSGISPISLCQSSHISMPILPYLYANPPISLCHTC